MQTIVGSSDILSFMCKGAGKWGMYISFNTDIPWEEIANAAPYLDVETHMHVFFSGHAYFLFDSMDDMEYYYERTVGDDGPTRLNKYDGDARVYALTCAPDGSLQTENT